MIVTSVPIIPDLGDTELTTGAGGEGGWINERVSAGYRGQSPRQSATITFTAPARCVGATAVAAPSVTVVFAAKSRRSTPAPIARRYSRN